MRDKFAETAGQRQQFQQDFILLNPQDYTTLVEVAYNIDRAHKKFDEARGQATERSWGDHRTESRSRGGINSSWRCHLCGRQGHNVVNCPDLEVAQRGLQERRSGGRQEASRSERWYR